MGPGGKITSAAVLFWAIETSMEAAKGSKGSVCRGGGGCRSSWASLAGKRGVLGCERLEPAGLEGLGNAGGDVGIALDGTDSSTLRVSRMCESCNDHTLVLLEYYNIVQFQRFRQITKSAWNYKEMWGAVRAYGEVLPMIFRVYLCGCDGPQSILRAQIMCKRCLGERVRWRCATRC